MIFNASRNGHLVGDVDYPAELTEDRLIADAVVPIGNLHSAQAHKVKYSLLNDSGKT